MAQKKIWHFKDRAKDLRMTGLGRWPLIILAKDPAEEIESLVEAKEFNSTKKSRWDWPAPYWYTSNKLEILSSIGNEGAGKVWFFWHTCARMRASSCLVHNMRPGQCAIMHRRKSTKAQPNYSKPAKLVRRAALEHATLSLEVWCCKLLVRTDITAQKSFDPRLSAPWYWVPRIMGFWFEMDASDFRWKIPPTT